jgi:hypothetical protein
MNFYQDFDLRVIALAEAIRHKLSDFEAIHHVYLEISVEGRVDGDLKIQYRVATNYENHTKAGRIEAALNEATRRFKWSEANAPVCLPKVEEPRTAAGSLD